VAAVAVQLQQLAGAQEALEGWAEGVQVAVLVLQTVFLAQMVPVAEVAQVGSRVVQITHLEREVQVS
jgi:hypothetical protein